MTKPQPVRKPRVRPWSTRKGPIERCSGCGARVKMPCLGCAVRGRKRRKDMNLADLSRLVADMRSAQKEYFRTRSSTALERSKQLERQVDKALQELADHQPRLFT